MVYRHYGISNLSSACGQPVRRLCAALTVAVLVSSAGCSGGSGASSSVNFEQQPLEFKLAYRDGASDDEVKVNRYRSLLSQLSSTYVDSPQGIYESMVTAQIILQKKGISESEINIMDGMNKIFETKIPNQKIDQYLAAYITLRDQGKSHNEAVKDLSQLATALSKN